MFKQKLEELKEIKDNKENMNVQNIDINVLLNLFSNMTEYLILLFQYFLILHCLVNTKGEVLSVNCIS